jgi:hypothetical protein
MKRTVIFILTLALGIIVCNAQVKHKMFVGTNNSGQFKLNIIPIKYDSTVTDRTILKCIDTLPGGLFHSKMYNVLYKDDSTKMAIQVTEGAYLFHTRYTVTEYWKNGNIKRITYYNKDLLKYWDFSYYADASPKEKGRYYAIITKERRRNSYAYLFNGKKGTWHYFNADGNLVKKEIYDSEGKVKKTKDINPPRRTLTTIFNPKHPKGQPYVIQ